MQEEHSRENSGGGGLGGSRTCPERSTRRRISACGSSPTCGAAPGGRPLSDKAAGATLQELGSDITRTQEQLYKARGRCSGRTEMEQGGGGGGDLVRHVVARAELDDDAAEEGVGAEVPHRGPARAVVQQELGRHHDERLGEWAVDLATQRVEVVGGGRAVDDTKVVPGGTRRVRLVREKGRDVSS